MATKIVAESVGKAAITEAIASLVAPVILGTLAAAGAPIAAEAVVVGAAAGLGAYLYSTFADPVVNDLYEIFGVASTKVEITNANGQYAGGAVYRNGLQGLAPINATMNLLSWALSNAATKPTVNAHIQVYISEQERVGFDLLPSDFLEQIAVALGDSKSGIENRTGATASGQSATNKDLLLPYLAPDSSWYSILQTGALIDLHMHDKDSGVDLQFSKDRLSVGGQLDGLNLAAGPVAAFGSGGADALDFGGATASLYVYGGDGSDTIRGGTSNDFLWGDTPGNQSVGAVDYIFGGSGNDQIFGGAGGDQVFGEAGEDYIEGGQGVDTIDGGADKDELWGGMDGDTIHGGAGDDVIRGGSSVPGENDTQTNLLFGDAGADKIFGALGADKITGGSDSDYLDGGPGIDTALYDDATAIQTLTLSGGGAPPDGFAAYGPGSFLTVKRGAETDTLHSIERLQLSSQKDVLTILPGGDLTDLKEIDAGDSPDGTKDILYVEDYALRLDGNHLIGDGVDIELKGFEEVHLSNEDDDDRITTGSIRTVYTGGGDDEISVSNPGVYVDLGSGNDILDQSAPGTIVHTGAGEDRIEASHNGQLLIEDASTIDRITYYRHTLTGGVQWGPESKYAIGIHGERYGRNAQGDLIIIDADGNETFIPRFNFATETNQRTAGLLVLQLDFQIERSNMWTAGFETAASILCALHKVGEALLGWPSTGWNDPLILDLNGDGITLSSRQGSGATFDIDGDGFAEPVGWVRGGDGMLVRDLDGNGTIDDVSEMFGNPSTPGFTQLASLDGNADGKISGLDSGLADFNGDGVIDAADTFETLKVWVDENEDGKTDAGELKSLAELDVVSVSVTPTATNTVDSGNLITGTATFERGDGSTGTVAEVQLDTDDFNTTWLGDSSVSAEAATRPNLKGFGTLADLHVAMTLTPELIDAVDAELPSLNTIELDGLRDAVRPILYAWASAVPVPAGTPGTDQAEDFLFVGETTRKGAVVYDFLIQKTDGQGTYYAYASGQAVYDAQQNVIDRPTREQVLAPERLAL